MTGFTYDPTNPNRIDTISFLTGTEPTGRVLKLYYTRNATTFEIQHYYQNLDGSFNTAADETVDGGAFQFGETKNASDYVNTGKVGFTYDASVDGSVTSISYLTAEPTGRVLKLYYTRNATTFEIQHYYQNLDGSFNTAADETVDGGAFQFGETKNASDYVNTGKVGFTYDASVDGSIASISYLTAEPTGRVLKLYYTRNATTFEIQHYYQNLDGSFNTAADETVDGGAFQFGETKNASDYVNTGKVGFTYDASVDGSIASISYLTATPTGRVLKLYYTRNEIEFTVEHYFEQLATGEYEKAQPAAEDSGVLKFDDVKNASDFVRTVPDYTYDPTNANAISTIRYNANGTPDGTVLKLYYTLDTANLTVEYNFIGGPKNGTTEPLTPSPVLKIGTVVNANDYLLTTTGEYANYSYVGAAYSGLGTGNKLVSGSNGKVVLTYKYAEVNVQVIHKYPGLEDVKTYDDTHFMDTDLTVSSIGNPITYYNNTLYTVVGTTVTVGGQTVTPSNDKVTLTGDTVITITYEVATANFTVEHYFEDEEGNYDLDSNIDSGSIRHGDTKTAAEFVRTVTGYTYNAAHTDAVSSITFSGEEAGEMVLELYYDIHVADYTVEHYFEKLDGSGYDKTETEGPFDIIFGQVKKADGYAKTVEGFTYDKTVSGSVAQITYDDEPFTNNVLKLYYTRNETTFEIQHFYQNLDGSFNRAADETVDGGAFRYGETKNASDYVNTGKIGFTYDAGIDGSIASISYLTAEPTGRVLKLYYTRNATTFEIQHFYQKVDGSFNAAADVTEDGGVFQFGSADKKAADYIRPVADYTYDASNPNRIDTISYQGAQPTGRVLKLYYNLNTTDLTVQYAFIGGPKDSKVETLDPSPELRIGTVVDADNYKLDTTGEYANYSFVSAEYSGLGENNQLTSTPGGKVVLTYRYAEVNVQVIHKYPALADVKTYDSAHFLDSQLLVSSVGNPVTYYNNTLYTVSGTAVTVGGEAAEPVDGKVTLTGDAVIVITYEVANANFTVEHYFQDANGSYNLDTNMDSGSIQHGDTKNAGDFVRSKAGYTYNPEHAGAVNSITFSGETAGEMVLKLYYDIHKASFKAEHYFEQLDGSFVKDAQDDEGEIIFGQSKEASEFVRTAEGFTYDASASGAVNKITYDVDPLTGNVLKLYYTRNEQNFTVEHYFEQTDGTYRLAASTDDDSGVFQYGETKNAADFVRTVENYTYDAQNANAVNTISYEGAAPTGTVLKLYYNLERYTLTIRYVYENGSTAAETVTQELPVGDSYSVDSPVIEGYAVDMETVSGVMPGADVIVVVTYRAEEIFDDPSVPLGPPESEGNLLFRRVQRDFVCGQQRRSGRNAR